MSSRRRGDGVKKSTESAGESPLFGVFFLLLFCFFFTSAERRASVPRCVCVSFLHGCVFTHRRASERARACVCVFPGWGGGVPPADGGRGERALLLPGAYLQPVALMQRNDYFYFRYFASLFPLSGMAPHRPTDYLGGCCHTCHLQPSSLSLLRSSPSPLRANPQRWWWWGVTVDALVPSSARTHHTVAFRIDRN